MDHIKDTVANVLSALSPIENLELENITATASDEDPGDTVRIEVKFLVHRNASNASSEMLPHTE